MDTIKVALFSVFIIKDFDYDNDALSSKMRYSRHENQGFVMQTTRTMLGFMMDVWTYFSSFPKESYLWKYLWIWICSYLPVDQTLWLQSTQLSVPMIRRPTVVHICTDVSTIWSTLLFYQWLGLFPLISYFEFCTLLPINLWTHTFFQKRNFMIWTIWMNDWLL